jgi:hypothetical protein
LWPNSAAHVHVSLGDVRDPPQQGMDVVERPDAFTEPGVRTAPMAGQGEDLQTAAGHEPLELLAIQELVGVPLDEDRVARRVGEAFGEGAQWRDSDARAEQRDAAPGTHPRAEPSVRPLDENSRSGSQ